MRDHDGRPMRFLDDRRQRFLCVDVVVGESGVFDIGGVTVTARFPDKTGELRAERLALLFDAESSEGRDGIVLAPPAAPAADAETAPVLRPRSADLSKLERP